MTRTDNQEIADAHEADMAEWTEGLVQKGSGSQWHAQMDTRNSTRDTPIPMAGDGKATRGKGITVTREMWAKAVEQAGPVAQPFLGLRWYRPGTTLLTVDQDLVAITPEFFKRLLRGARKWEEQEARLLGLVDPIAQGSFSILDPAAVVEATLGGCTCCR